ncbi:NACHT, LRR and PYD domains-containing protein 12-like isoform X1 [Triplophysa dalaica]|uniref:NACHT, LRR and PYD domains-containing protein 12-like isoform X1 n=1 Tax=Triplophysa dalaica TaxID=1582913 RepID=UPI0024DFB775|nr:NACHT, LRR and PYD domains-containing protein 12-like isoform X1 [Triplophysa dalaica]XP_056613375.1 NACHT, LRR and PYD domains-containing protein 12-like isoform X1 [Triplophysa dalaica]
MSNTQTSTDGDSSPQSSLFDLMRSNADFSCVSMKSNRSMNPPVVFKNHDISPAVSCESELLKTFKSNLRKKFECLCEGISQERNPTPLNEIYTELYITESESREISNEHDVRQIETQSRRTVTEDTPIKCNDIFKALPEQDKPIRRVLTKGVAGIGKTVSVQKFILDWAEGKENQDVHLIFPLPFREINLMKNQTLSLLDLLHLFFPETKELEISSGEYKVLFIFDGLDECRVSLDFHSSVRLCDVSESASVDVILTNLMKGNLLPSALIWITSRPAAADLIPSECVDRVTEVRGFTDKQKEEYFSKRISDESLNNRIISHLKSSRSLYIMCHIPVFCWISATVLERMLSEAESEGEIPKTLTQMYTHFLIIQTNIKHQKDYEKKVKNDEDMIFKLGKLAFEQLEKGNLIFYDEDLRECGIDVAEASVYSGLCTQIFREEFGLYLGKVYSFVHLTIQEHLAALYVHLSFVNYNMNVFDQISAPTYTPNDGEFRFSYLHHRAIDEALQSKNGHLDLFLRFLLGLSLESNQNLIHHLQTGGPPFKKEETVVFIQMRIWRDPSLEKSINLFHCLNELGDPSLIEEVQQYLQSGKIREMNLSPSQWSALVFVLLTSEQNMNVFKLKEIVGPQIEAKEFSQMEPSTVTRSDQLKQIQFVGSDEFLQKLLPVVKQHRSVDLSDCNITDEGWAALSSALRSYPSHLRHLDLSHNNVGDSGVKLISTVLENPLCKLEKLGLSRCNVTDEGCVALTSALRSNPSHLRHLNLSDNKVGDSGVKLISAGLENPHCKLEKLELCKCNITDEGCAALSSALRSNPSHLRELNLYNNNNVGDLGLKLISTVLENPQCKLEKLELFYCDITDEGCVALSAALRSNPSHLRHLDLSGNNVVDSGVKLISTVLENPHCKLETLVLNWCNITDDGCVALTSALRSNPSHLRHLDLYGNNVGDSGVKLLSYLKQDPGCKLNTLHLSDCYITDEGYVALTSALRSNPSHLTELKLSRVNLGDSGMKLLLAVLENPLCKLEKLWLNQSNITDEGCAALSSALRSNPSHLIELELSQNYFRESRVNLISHLMRRRFHGNDTAQQSTGLTSTLRSYASEQKEIQNKLGDSGVKLISTVLENPHCKLEKLRLSRCNITDKGCVALTSALRSNPSHLRHLDLSVNKVGDSGVKLICDVLENPHCKLDTLKLWMCNITDESCVDLTSALRSNPSHLRHLDLSDNKVGDSGVKLISTVLENPHCKLDSLKLRRCKITDEGFVALTSALRSNPSHLRHLDLSDNKVGDSGVKLISTVLENPLCKLETLTLNWYKITITDEGCVDLTSDKTLGDSGVKLISTVLENPHCKLKTLQLSQCNITDEGCVALTSALRSNPSHLRQLNLSVNNLGDSGVKLICDVLENPLCKLETLRLWVCNITDEGCAALSSALRSNPSHLRHLDLSDNKVGDSGVKLICDVLKNPLCKLETLKLWRCKITDEGCAALTSALRSNPSHLRDLNLSLNNVGDSGVKLICDVLKNPLCKLETLWLRSCSITDEGCVALTSALRSNPSHRRHLDLSHNNLGDSGVKLISDLKDDPQYKLETLKIDLPETYDSRPMRVGVHSNLMERMSYRKT